MDILLVTQDCVLDYLKKKKITVVIGYETVKWHSLIKYLAFLIWSYGCRTISHSVRMGSDQIE